MKAKRVGHVKVKNMERFQRLFPEGTNAMFCVGGRTCFVHIPVKKRKKKNPS